MSQRMSALSCSSLCPDAEVKAVNSTTETKISKHSFSWPVDDVLAEDLHNVSVVFVAWEQLDVVCTLAIVNKRSGGGQELRYDLVWSESHCNPLYFALSVDVVQTFGELADGIGAGGLVGADKKKLEGKYVSSLSTKTSGKILFRASFRKIVVRVDLTLYKNNSLSIYHDLWKFDFVSPAHGKGVPSDVILTCGDKSFECHKVVLAACSEKFKEMFTGTKADLPEMRIEDLKPEVLESLLRFIYMNRRSVEEIEVSWDLFEAAMTYDIPDLAQGCLKKLQDNISATSCGTILEASYKFDQEDVFKFSIDFLKQNKEKVFQTPGWKRIKQNDPLLDSILRGM